MITYNHTHWLKIKQNYIITGTSQISVPSPAGLDVSRVTSSFMNHTVPPTVATQNEEDDEKARKKKHLEKEE